MARKRRSHIANSFSLIELIVVMAIVSILALMAGPAFFSMMRSSNLTTGSIRLVDQLNLSRQVAMAKNCQVEVRLYQLPDANSASTTPQIYRAFQSFSLDDGGSQTNAINDVTYLPTQIYLSTNSTASTLLNNSNPPYFVTGVIAGTQLGAYPPSAYNYVDFHFNADGSTDLTPSFNSPWYISLANVNDPVQNTTTGLPVNFFTIQIDAQTGRIRYFTPN